MDAYGSHPESSFIISQSFFWFNHNERFHGDGHKDEKWSQGLQSQLLFLERRFEAFKSLPERSLQQDELCWTSSRLIVLNPWNLFSFSLQLSQLSFTRSFINNPLTTRQTRFAPRLPSTLIPGNNNSSPFNFHWGSEQEKRENSNQHIPRENWTTFTFILAAQAYILIRLVPNSSLSLTENAK